MGNVDCCHESHSSILDTSKKQDENDAPQLRNIAKNQSSSSKSIASVQTTINKNQQEKQEDATNLQDSLTGSLMVSLVDSKFDPRFIEIMKQKTKLIDISRMCLYIDVLGSQKQP